MFKIVAIAFGGAIGSLLRYWFSGAVTKQFNNVLPLGTLGVNLIGSLIIGFLWGLFDSVVVSQNIRLFLFIGFLGSFTTFSTFSLENFHLMRDGEYLFFFLNILLNLIGGIILAFVGFFISKALT